MSEITKIAKMLVIEELLEKIAAKKGQKVKPGSLKGGPSKPSSSAPAGKGGRFKALEKDLSKEKGVKNPEGLAATLGRAKFGKGKFQSMAAKGHKAASTNEALVQLLGLLANSKKKF